MKKLLYLAILAGFLAGCGSMPKFRMKNCIKNYDGTYECEQMPDKPDMGSQR